MGLLWEDGCGHNDIHRLKPHHSDHTHLGALAGCLCFGSTLALGLLLRRATTPIEGKHAHTYIRNACLQTRVVPPWWCCACLAA